MSRSRRILIGLLAAGGALALFSLAPGRWESGPGRLEVAVHGDVVVDGAVDVGSPAAVRLEGRSGLVAVTADLADGVRVNGPIEVVLTVVDETVGRPPISIGDIAVTIVLADGAGETVPVLSRDPGYGGAVGFRAVRRPPVDVGVVLGLLFAVIVLWVSEVVPIFVTALGIPVVLTFTGVAAAGDALAPFFDPIIVLFFAGFLMAEAMQRVELDHRVAVEVVARAGRSPARLFAAMLGIAAFMSMWMSNTAAVAVLLPIALAVTEPIEHHGYRKAMVLGLAYAATIGGVGSAIGTPANLLAIDFLDTVTGREISFAGWFWFGLPMVVLFLPLLGLYMWRVSGVQVDPARFAESRSRAQAQAAAAPALSRRQWTVLAVFGAVLAGWLTQQWHGQAPGIVALAGAVLLFALGLIEPVDLGRISWPTLLTFGGGLALGSFMVFTGTSDWVVTRLGAVAAWPPLAGVAAVAAVSLALTTVASNTGSAATLIPLAIPLAGIIGVTPTLLVVVVAIASSVDFALVIGTPPTMLAYSTELFTVREILKKGFVLDLVGVVLLIAAVVPLWRFVGIV